MRPIFGRAVSGRTASCDPSPAARWCSLFLHVEIFSISRPDLVSITITGSLASSVLHFCSRCSWISLAFLLFATSFHSFAHFLVALRFVFSRLAPCQLAVTLWLRVTASRGEFVDVPGRQPLGTCGFSGSPVVACRSLPGVRSLPRCGFGGVPWVLRFRGTMAASLAHGALHFSFSFVDRFLRSLRRLVFLATWGGVTFRLSFAVLLQMLVSLAAICLICSHSRCSCFVTRMCSSAISGILIQLLVALYSSTHSPPFG